MRPTFPQSKSVRGQLNNCIEITSQPIQCEISDSRFVYKELQCVRFRMPNHTFVWTLHSVSLFTQIGKQPELTNLLK